MDAVPNPEQDPSNREHHCKYRENSQFLWRLGIAGHHQHEDQTYHALLQRVRKEIFVDLNDVFVPARGSTASVTARLLPTSATATKRHNASGMQQRRANARRMLMSIVVLLLLPPGGAGTGIKSP